MVKFKAQVVRVIDDKEIGVYSVVVAERLVRTGEHVEFHRADDPGNGVPYCVVTHPWNACKYGGVLSWGVKDRVMVVRLSDEAAAALDAEGGFRLDLDALDAADVESLEKGLGRVFVDDVPRDDSIVDVRELTLPRNLGRL